MAQDAPLSDRELLRWVVNAWDRLPARPIPLIRIVEDIRARLAEPEEPTLRSLVGAVPDLSGGIESVTYIRMKREIAELRAERDALVPLAWWGLQEALGFVPEITPPTDEQIAQARAILAREGT